MIQSDKRRKYLWLLALAVSAKKRRSYILATERATDYLNRRDANQIKFSMNLASNNKESLSEC